MSIATSPIAVALSGGADSLAVLLGLHKTGQPLVAVHGLFGQKLLHDFLVACGLSSGPWPDAEHTEVLVQLEKITASLGIPLHCMDFSDTFSQKVVRPFVEQYAMGQTPNPCALCNRAIKFGALLEACMALGASHLATGHYARLESPACPGQTGLAGLPFAPRPQAQENPASRGCPELPALFPGTDKTKDQSYFLALVPEKNLARTIFPLALAQKAEVLQFLRSLDITPPQPKESQEICFIPGNRSGPLPGYRDFIPFMAERLGVPLPGPGPIRLVDSDSGTLKKKQEIGRHRGLWQYTEGQRKGLGIGWKVPLHVLAKDQTTNTLYLGPYECMGTASLLAGPANILVPPQFWPKTVLVKTRYREAPRQATVRFLTADAAKAHLSGAEPFDPAAIFLEVFFLEKEKTVAPGQLVAVYAPEDMRLLAGGIICDSGALQIVRGQR